MNIEAVSTLFNKVGPGIFVTHSQSGERDWRTIIKNRNVRAIISFEPASTSRSPRENVPQPMTLGGRAFTAINVSQSDFMLLTKIPIIN